MDTSSYLFESPLIEQGTVLLDTVHDTSGFALHQQYFHKSLCLLLEHGDGYTKGVLLNRPSGLVIDGWRAWFGGDVATGGFFHGGEDGAVEHPREVTCLHALEGEAVARLSLPVLRGVSQTSLEGALALVEQGVATREDFWVFVGCAGWAPKQLEAEVEDGTWLMASADSATLLRELLRQGAALPPPAGSVTVEAARSGSDDGGSSGGGSDGGGSGALAADGLGTWRELMCSIGRGAEVEKSRGCLADRMLGEWVRHRLHAPPPREAAALAAVTEGTEGVEDAEGVEAAAASVVTARRPEAAGSLVGAVLCAGAVPAPRFLLHEQYLLQSVLLVVEQLGEGYLAVALNRPTAIVAFLDHGEVERRLLSFGGDCQLNDGSGVEMQLDANGILWLHHRPELGGEEIGRSGVWRTWAARAAEQVRRGKASLADFLLVSGLVPFEADE